MQSCHRVILQESKCKYNVYLPEKLEEASKLLYPPLLFVILTLFRPYSHQRFYWGGDGIQNLPPPSHSPPFQPCFTIWHLKSRYGYNTRSNMLCLFSFLANVQSLAAHCNGHNGGTKTHKTFQNVMKDLEETVKLSLPSQTPWARKRTWGEGAGGKKFTVQMDPFSRLLGSTANDLECFGRKTKIDRYLKFSIFRLAPKTEKLNHATDCNIVREAKLSLSFIFLFTVHRIKETKPCHRLQHCQRSKIVAQFCFSLHCSED